MTPQEKAILEVLSSYVYNDQNQAGDKLIIIDASDLPVIIPEIIEKLKGTTVDSFLTKRICATFMKP